MPRDVAVYLSRILIAEWVIKTKINVFIVTVNFHTVKWYYGGPEGLFHIVFFQSCILQNLHSCKHVFCQYCTFALLH